MAAMTFLLKELRGIRRPVYSLNCIVWRILPTQRGSRQFKGRTLHAVKTYLHLLLSLGEWLFPKTRNAKIWTAVFIEGLAGRRVR